MPLYKRALSYLLVGSMSLCVNRFGKTNRLEPLFNIFNGGRKYTILMQLFKCSPLPLFHSSCVFIRVASYATLLHYSNIYENYVLKSQQSKHGALLLTLELRLPESHRLSANVGEVKAPARVEIFRQEEVSW